MPVMSERERAYIEICARDMHPDLYEGIPESRAASDLRKRYALLDQMDDLRKIYTLDDFDLPSYGFASPSFHATVTDWSRADLKDKNYIDEAASQEKLRRMVRAIRSKFKNVKIEKQYEGDYFRTRLTLESGLVVSITVSRAAVCTKRVVGQEYVEPSKGYYRDIVEYDCSPVSLLKSE